MAGLWVLRTESDDLATYLRFGEPAKSVTRIGAGPDGQTVRSSDTGTLEAWLAALQ